MTHREQVYNELSASFSQAIPSLYRAFYTLQDYHDAQMFGALESTRTNGRMEELNHSISSLRANFDMISRLLHTASHLVPAEREYLRQATHSLDQVVFALRNYHEAQQINASRSTRNNGNIAELNRAVSSLHAILALNHRRLQDASRVVAAARGNSQPGLASNNLSTNTIDEFPLHTTNLTPQMIGSEPSADCCICMEEMSLGMMVAVLPCSHFMHYPCILQWLEHTNACPLCRRRAR